ncbi:MAG: AI-2E family transporter [Gemmatimonadota bacterium]|nr:AI-2E family transporter [Gemmatimonadota bacterium]
MTDDADPVAERHMSDPGIDPRRFRGVFLLILVAAISWLFLRMVQPFIVALLLGAIFSALLWGWYKRIRRWTGERAGLASGITLVVFIFLLLVPLALFLGIVAQQALHVSESVGPWLSAMQERLNEPDGVDRLVDSLPFAETIRPYQHEIAERAAGVASSLGGFVVTQLAALTRGTVTFIFLLFVMLYSMFFFLKDGERFIERLLYYFPLSTVDERRMLDKFVSVSRATVKGTFLIGIVQGGLAGLSFWVAGVPSTAFWSTVMAVLSIIPGIGSVLVWLPAGIYLISAGKVVAGVGVLLWCAVVVGMVDNLMRPWLVGRDTKMPDLMILLGTLGGLVVFGAAGVIVGPIVAALFMTVWELYGEAFKSVLPEARVPPVKEPETGT